MAEIQTLFVLLGALCFAAGGMCLIVQQKRLAGSLVTWGVVLAIIGALAPVAPAYLGQIATPNAGPWIAIGLCLICVWLRQWALLVAVALVAAAGLLGWPVAVVIALPFVLLFAIGALSRFLSAIWGPELAGHVLGVYVVRGIDRLFGVGNVRNARAPSDELGPIP